MEPSNFLGIICNYSIGLFKGIVHILLLFVYPKKLKELQCFIEHHGIFQSETFTCMLIPSCATTVEDGFEYKVVTQRKYYQNLKLYTLRVLNNYKLEFPMVEFFSHEFLSAPIRIWTHDPLMWNPMLYHGAKKGKG